jgi:membrane-bound lytic murein transglycosylase A
VATDTPAPPADLVPVGYDDLEGWRDDDHGAAFAAFRLSAAAIAARPPRRRPLGPDGAELQPAAAAALAAGAVDGAGARAFFETWFRPLAVRPSAGDGFVTGYYEPEIDGSIEATSGYSVPLHARPADLVEIAPDDDRTGLDPALTWARRGPDGRLGEHPDRGAVMAGALGPGAATVGHVADWIEAFFIHVQGSARLRLADGGVRRVTFDGKSGHPYFPIARVLVERGLATPAGATADVLRDFLRAHPDEAAAVLARNRSYIFFRAVEGADPALGPVAAAGVQLTPGRSLAVDRTLHTFHVPVFVDADTPGPAPFRRLMVAQDTGSAIVGPARGDIFFGSGEAGFSAAARVRHPARFTVLWPRRAPGGP